MDNLEQALLESENSLMLLSDEELITPINDILIINPETRLIEVPDTELLLGVFSENLVEKKYFKCPRIVLNNIDLYECFIFINYVSASGRVGYIQSENVELDETEQYILFDWDLTNNVFDKNKDSTIYFSVSAKQYLEDSEPVFATRKAQGKMYETINGTEHVTQEHADIILQILAGMKTKIDLPKDEDGNLLVPEEGQTLLFKEDGTTYYGTPSSGGGGTPNAVQYVKQTLTEEEQKVARGNIGAASVAELGKVQEEIGDLKDNGVSGTTSGIIDIEKYGIVQADYTEPFTVEIYEVAYNNGLNIQKAIDDAKDRGLKEITLPSGNYPVCYSSDSDVTYNAIIDSQDINFIGYGAKLYVIYDEDGTNPYFTGETPRLLQGTIIKTNSDIRGFHLVGERAFRTNENTKYREFSSGIGLTETTNGNLIKDCIVELFSGDGIGCHKYMEQIAGWEGSEGIFTSVDWDISSNSWVESKTKFTSKVHGATWFDITRPILLRNTGYFLYTTAPLRVLCFDENDNYIGDVRFWQGEYFYFLPNTAKWYLQITREVEHDTTATETWGHWIGYGFYNDATIDNCEIRFNQRGGISNVPSGSTIKNCIIHHNGCAYENMVAFYDSTQFGIDIEDVYIHDITIEGCQIFNNLQGVLYRCWGIRFKNCSIYGYVNSLNACVDFYAENTRFNWSCTMNLPTPFGTKVAIGCIFNGTKAKEILDVASGIVTSTKVNTDGIVNFLNANGEVVFKMDLTTLIYIAPELVVDGLEIGCDFTTLEVGATSFDMKYGNATATASNGMIVESGCVPVGNGNYVKVTDNENDFSANEFTVEMFHLGMPYHAMRSISGNYDLIGSDLIGTSPAQDNLSSCHVCFPYNGGSKAYKTYVFNSVYVDGVETTANLTKIPNLGTDKYAHMVFVGTNEGKVLCYINGFQSAEDISATDFVSWDTSDFTNFYLYGGHANENQILKHFNLYNKALNEDEIKKNLSYFKKTFGYDS